MCSDIEPFIDEDYDSYVKKMETDGTWGGEALLPDFHSRLRSFSGACRVCHNCMMRKRARAALRYTRSFFPCHLEPTHFPRSVVPRRAGAGHGRPCASDACQVRRDDLQHAVFSMLCSPNLWTSCVPWVLSLPCGGSCAPQTRDLPQFCNHFRDLINTLLSSVDGSCFSLLSFSHCHAPMMAMQGHDRDPSLILLPNLLPYPL